MKKIDVTIDAITGVTTRVERDETAQESVEREALAALELKIANDEAQSAQAKIKVGNKLAALGLTTDDLKALGL